MVHPKTARADDYGLARLKVSASPLYLREAEVRRGVDLLQLGQSHLLRAIDPLLREAGIGRAHYRMLGHVARWPGLAMGDLIDLSGTSKQALTRVARELEERGLILIAPGLLDRRRRELRPSETGVALVAQFEARLAAVMADAYAGAGQDAVTGFWQVLEGLVPVASRIKMAEWERNR